MKYIVPPAKFYDYLTLRQGVRVLQEACQSRVVQLVEGLHGRGEHGEGRLQPGIVPERCLQGDEEGGEPLVSGQDLSSGGEG